MLSWSPKKEYRSNGLVIREYALGEAALELWVHNENTFNAELAVELAGENIEISWPMPIYPPRRSI